MLINILFLCDNLPLYCLLVVRSPTCRTQTIHVVFDVVEAELADLTQEVRISNSISAYA